MGLHTALFGVRRKHVKPNAKADEYTCKDKIKQKSRFPQAI